MGNLDGQVALVTGGGRGLGRAIALEFASQGAAVAIDDVFRDENGVSAAEQVAAEIIEAGGRALALHEDVTTGEGASSMIEQVVEKFGGLNSLVCCAGNVVQGPFDSLTEEQWDSVIRLHLRGHFLSAKYAIPHLKKQETASILTLGSRGAFYQLPRNKREPFQNHRKPQSAAYSTAKAGVLGFTTTLALELWDTGVNVNSLIPSAQTQLFPESKPRSVGGVPPSRSLDPADIAPVAVFLCSPEGNDISGKFVYSSGGDIILYGEQLSLDGSRMLRKDGRWVQEELADSVRPLVGIL